MPAKGQLPPRLAPSEQPRAVWEEAFKREFVRLRPHLENLHKMLQQHAVGALAQHTVDSDPAKAAREWSKALDVQAPAAAPKTRRA